MLTCATVRVQKVRKYAVRFATYRPSKSPQHVSRQHAQRARFGHAPPRSLCLDTRSRSHMAHVPPGNVPLRVAVRVRPRLRRDARNGTDTIAADERRVMVGGNDAFTFLQAFGPEATQRAVYNYCAAPQVAAVLDGLDACASSPSGRRAQGRRSRCSARRAATPRLRTASCRWQPPRDLLRRGSAGGRGPALPAPAERHTFVEIHREGLFDLLTPERSKLTVRETDEDGAFAEGAARLRIRSVPALLAAVAEGSSRRRTAATSVHAHSSRSHALLSL